MINLCQQVAVVLFLAIFTLAGAVYRETGKLVETKYGPLEGTVFRSRLRREYYGWLGIPYAKPPVGILRFASPEPFGKWNGVLNARYYGSRCAQYDSFQDLILGREDCLTLNIFAPKKLIDDTATTSRLPVMVFVHGGAYAAGASSDYRPDYFMDQDIILVTLNYRLSALGFLNTNDGLIRGNMGLKDQALAFRWVNENIEFFGGDPDRVTIFGESAGSMSAHLHMMSPMSKGLFHKAICQSGVATTPFTLNKEPEKQAKLFVEQLGCPFESTAKMTNCLRGKSTEEILRLLSKTSIFFNADTRKQELIFSPTIESVEDNEAFMVSSPEKLIEGRNVVDIPWMTGVNSAEGLVMMIPFITNSTFRQQLENNWKEVGASDLLLSAEEQKGVEAIREFYFPNNTNLTSVDAIPGYLKLHSDRWFYIELQKTTNEHSTRAPTYVYYYSKLGPSLIDLFHRNERLPRLLNIIVSRFQEWINVDLLKMPREALGAAHSDELSMMFPFYPLYNVRPGHPDFEFSKEIIKLWVDFATNDKTELSFNNTVFPQHVPSDDPEYFEISEEPKLVQLHLKDRVEFWDSISNH